MKCPVCQVKTRFRRVPHGWEPGPHNAPCGTPCWGGAPSKADWEAGHVHGAMGKPCPACTPNGVPCTGTRGAYVRKGSGPRRLAAEEGS